MKKLIAVLMLLLTFYLPANANTQSQALVLQGRGVLFNNGLPTCTGVILADGYFQSAVAADSADQEAHLFYALTRLAVSGLKQGDGPGMETILDLLNAFGISRNSNEYFVYESIYTDLPESTGGYLPPDTIPDGTQIYQFIDTAFLDLLTAVLENLSHVTNTAINITLTAAETGDSQVEVDWGDVLLFKSVVETLKGFVLTINAYDINGIDTAELIQLAQADIFQIQRDLLDKYPSALSLMSAGVGVGKLTQAKTILISAITDFESAVTFITGESDSQMDDLFSFNEEDMNDIDKRLAYLNEIKASISEDRVAVFDDESQNWALIDPDGRSLYLYFSLEMGSLERANIYSYPENGYAFGIEGGNVTSLDVDGSTINLEIDGWATGCGDVHIDFEGTLNAAKDTITSGTWVRNSCGSFDSGSFTGTRTWLEEYGDEINFNAVFGSATNAPLDIRAVCPEFNIVNDPVAGTFPAYPDPGDPVLNGVVPADILTNTDATLEMDLQPKGSVTIPELDIVINGNKSDWLESALVFTDMIGEKPYWAPSMDIEKAYLAKDDSYLYIAMEFNNGTPSIPDNEWAENVNYNLSLRTFPTDHPDRQLNISAGYNYIEGVWQVTVSEYDDGIWYERESYEAGSLAIGIDFIEFRVPLSVINSRTGGLTGKFLSFKTANNWGNGDNNATLLQVNPSFNIGGSLVVGPGFSGNVIIKLLSDPEGIFVANTHVDGLSSYSLPNLASTDEYYSLTAFQDLDGNGIYTSGEPRDMSEIWGLSNPQSVPLDLYSNLDTDNDGILDCIEDKNQDGVVDADETDPFNLDSDGDGIQDGTESGLTLSDIGYDTDRSIFIPDADPSTQTDPLLKDTDGDGFSDWQEDPNKNGSVDEGEGNPLEKTSMPEIIAYRDDFDDVTEHQNWSPLLGQSWEFEQIPNSESGNLSYNGWYSGASLPPDSPDFGIRAVSKVNTLPDVTSTGIELFTIFVSPDNGVEGNRTGVFFGLSLKKGGDPSNSDDYNLHSVYIHEDAGEMYLSVSKNRVQMSSTELTGMDRNTWFCLGLNIDESNALNWGVGDWFNQDSAPGVDYLYRGTVPGMVELSGSLGVFTGDGGAGFAYFQVIGKEGSSQPNSIVPMLNLLLQ